MSYDLNILVNGNRCRQYLHKGRTYIEAKEGSEYAIELKNNSWERILAVVSVDGLNVVDGEAADPDGAGYVLDAYTAQKFYGFQYSKEKVATFKFGAMGAVKIDPATGQPELDPDTGKEIPLGYAASKGDGSEKNAGVIGIKIWDELAKRQPPPPPPPPPPPVYDWSNITSSYSMGGSMSGSFCGTGSCYGISASWSCQSVSSSYSSRPADWLNTPISGATTTVTTRGISQTLLSEAIADAKAVQATALANCKGGTIHDNEPQLLGCITLSDTAVEDVASFDMETQWGESRNYKVQEITFDRNELIHSFDIYYASRESLIAMGINLGTEKRVSFPESFKETKYAKPPKGWRG